jgi:signal transduction histidine kinase
MLERMSERERIARDLHDTFFQGIQGLFLRFNTGTSMLPLDEPAREIFVKALEESDRVMSEGRELVLDLRTDEAVIASLAEDLAKLSPAGSEGAQAAYRVTILGEVRPLHATCARELVRISQEAVHNAFHHANAQVVKVEVIYEKGFLQLKIRDNGKGIDASIVREGRRPGHLGLVGMNERAARLGARYSLWSEHGEGTEIRVEVPARIAYATTQL